MLSKGVIAPSTSPWASPILLVPKKDGELRFVVDFRKINAAMKKNSRPLPRCDDLIDLMGQISHVTPAVSFVR